jgi:hypothetical protein
MRLRLALSVAFLALFAFAVSGSATDLNFDDIDTGGGVVAMPNGYGGWGWAHNIGVYGTVQDPYNPHTPPNRALFNFDQCCDYAESLVTSNIGPVTFQGAWFAGVQGLGGPIFFNLYLGGNLVATSGSLDPTNVPTFLDSGYNGLVDAVGIVGTEGFFVMDDFTFSGGGVPEPGTLLMFASGVAALGGVVRRKLSL